MTYTYRELFTKYLPEPYRSQAIANTNAVGFSLGADTTHSVDNLDDALSCAFAWAGSPEGHDYWSVASKGQFPAARAPIPEPGDRLADLESRIAVLEGLFIEPCVADADPEPVDPGAGYRLVEVGEYIETGDEWLEEDGRWAASYWKTGSCVSKAIETPLRRKIAAPPAPPTYRLLNPDEIIREGDEWYFGRRGHEWADWVGAHGTAVGAHTPPTRRKLKSYEDA